MREYVLRKFSEDRLARVSRDWAAIAGSEEFEVELAPLFTWCASHTEHRDGDAHALELYAPQLGETDAILEMVNGRRGTMSKLLKLHVSPRFWDSDTDPSIRSELVEAYASAFVHVIASGMDEGMDEIKIYGRNDSMLKLLVALKEEWSKRTTGWPAIMQGRWLTITRGTLK